jgi:hypothetical protein
VVYLRKDLSERTASLTNVSRHASRTIILVSLLYSLCHVSYLVILIFRAIVYGCYGNDAAMLPSPIHQGNIVGATEFTLPLLYAVLYPIILIARKPELRERYINLYRMIKSCCGARCSAE